MFAGTVTVPSGFTVMAVVGLLSGPRSASMVRVMSAGSMTPPLSVSEVRIVAVVVPPTAPLMGAKVSTIASIVGGATEMVYVTDSQLEGLVISQRV